MAAHAAEMVAEFGKADAWEVTVLTGAMPAAELAQTCAEIADALAAEGLRAEPFITEGSSPQIIFDAIERFHPDLVVLGGFHHAKGLLTEASWLQVVEQVKLPVLLYR
jgi:nucleotide-binding universal stress UspA family protein